MNGTVSGLFINSTVDPKVASVEYEGTVSFPRGGKNAYSDVKLDKPTNEHTGKWLGDSVEIIVIDTCCVGFVEGSGKHLKCIGLGCGQRPSNPTLRCESAQFAPSPQAWQ